MSRIGQVPRGERGPGAESLPDWRAFENKLSTARASCRVASDNGDGEAGSPPSIPLIADNLMPLVDPLLNEGVAVHQLPTERTVHHVPKVTPNTPSPLSECLRTYRNGPLAVLYDFGAPVGLAERPVTLLFEHGHRADAAAAQAAEAVLAHRSARPQIINGGLAGPNFMAHSVARSSSETGATEDSVTRRLAGGVAGSSGTSTVVIAPGSPVLPAAAGSLGGSRTALRQSTTQRLRARRPSADAPAVEPALDERVLQLGASQMAATAGGTLDTNQSPALSSSSPAAGVTANLRSFRAGQRGWLANFPADPLPPLRQPAISNAAKESAGASTSERPTTKSSGARVSSSALDRETRLAAPPRVTQAMSALPESNSAAASNAVHFLVEPRSVSFDAVGGIQLEPLFGSVVLVDLRTKTRLSESFSFELGLADMEAQFGFEMPMRTLEPRALFRAGQGGHASSHVLLVRLERILRGDVEADLPMFFGRAKDQGAALASYTADTRRVVQRPETTQPLAWGYVRLFTETGEWDSDVRGQLLIDLFPCSNNGTFSDDWIFETGMRSIQKLEQIPGGLTLKISKLSGNVEKDPPLSLIDGNFEKFSMPLDSPEPAAGGDSRRSKPRQPLVARAIENLPMASSSGANLSSVVPHTRFVHNLYVYVDSVPVNKTEASVQVEVKLMRGDDLVRAFYTKCTAKERQFALAGLTSVAHRHRQPAFHDEIKIRLPHDRLLDPHLRLVFTFVHIAPAGGKAKREGKSWMSGRSATSSKSRTTLGTAVLPLLDQERPNTPPGLLADGVHLVPVTAVRWIESKKPMAVVRTQLHSSITSHDEDLRGFWQHKESGFSSSSVLKQGLLSLFKARARSNLEFLPVLLNQLLALVCHAHSGNPANVADAVRYGSQIGGGSRSSAGSGVGGGGGGNKSMGVNAVHAIVQLLHRLHQANPEMARVAAFDYVRRRFHHIPGQIEYAYEHLTRYYGLWLQRQRKGIATSGRRSDGSSPKQPSSSSSSSPSSAVEDKTQLDNEFPSVDMFMLELIMRSMALRVSEKPGDDASSRSRRFGEPVWAALRQLLRDILSRLKLVARPAEVVRSVADFFGRALAVADRGDVFRAIWNVVGQLSVEKHVNVIMDILASLAAHDSFVALNLPLARPSFVVWRGVRDKAANASSSSSSGSGGAGDSLQPPSPQQTRSRRQSGSESDRDGDFEYSNHWERAFWHEHFLVGLTIRELRRCLLVPVADVRRRAVTTVRDMLRRHDSDPRYSSAGCRAAVFGMYLPLVALVSDLWRELSSSGGSSGHSASVPLSGDAGVDGRMSDASVARSQSSRKLTAGAPTFNVVDDDYDDEVVGANGRSADGLSDLASGRAPRTDAGRAGRSASAPAGDGRKSIIRSLPVVEQLELAVCCVTVLRHCSHSERIRPWLEQCSAAEARGYVDMLLRVAALLGAEAQQNDVARISALSNGVEFYLESQTPSQRQQAVRASVIRSQSLRVALARCLDLVADPSDKLLSMGLIEQALDGVLSLCAGALEATDAAAEVSQRAAGGGGGAASSSSTIEGPAATSPQAMIVEAVSVLLAVPNVRPLLFPGPHSIRVPAHPSEQLAILLVNLSVSPDAATARGGRALLALAFRAALSACKETAAGQARARATADRQAKPTASSSPGANAKTGGTNDDTMPLCVLVAQLRRAALLGVVRGSVKPAVLSVSLGAVRDHLTETANDEWGAPRAIAALNGLSKLLNTTGAQLYHFAVQPYAQTELLWKCARDARNCDADLAATWFEVLSDALASAGYEEEVVHCLLHLVGIIVGRLQALGQMDPFVCQIVVRSLKVVSQAHETMAAAVSPAGADFPLAALEFWSERGLVRCMYDALVRLRTVGRYKAYLELEHALLAVRLHSFRHKGLANLHARGYEVALELENNRYDDDAVMIYYLATISGNGVDSASAEKRVYRQSQQPSLSNEENVVAMLTRLHREWEKKLGCSVSVQLIHPIDDGSQVKNKYGDADEASVVVSLEAVQPYFAEEGKNVRLLGLEASSPIDVRPCCEWDVAMSHTHLFLLGGSGTSDQLNRKRMLYRTEARFPGPLASSRVVGETQCSEMGPDELRQLTDNLDAKLKKEIARISAEKRRKQLVLLYCLATKEVAAVRRQYALARRKVNAILVQKRENENEAAQIEEDINKE